MANYTMTIQEMVSNPLTQSIFPSDYDFYVDDEKAKKVFEDKFINHYYYREIGFESPFMFIQKLESHLILNMPYWIQLYQTELESHNINFMLNKDLRETFIREVDSENQTNGTNSGQQNSSSTNSSQQNSSATSSSEQNTTSTNTVTQNETSTNTRKESSLQDGVSVASLTDGYLTGASSDSGTNTNSGTTDLTDHVTAEVSSTGNATTEGTSSDKMTTTGTSSQTNNGKTLEKTELISQGNIGVTSSAQLLKEWRDVLINMDKIIIESCNDLFLKIY